MSQYRLYPFYVTLLSHFSSPGNTALFHESHRQYVLPCNSDRLDF